MKFRCDGWGQHMSPTRVVRVDDDTGMQIEAGESRVCGIVHDQPVQRGVADPPHARAGAGTECDTPVDRRRRQASQRGLVFVPRVGVGVGRAERSHSRSTRRHTVASSASSSTDVGGRATWNASVPVSSSANTPSSTIAWTCTLGLSAAPNRGPRGAERAPWGGNRWRIATAPLRPSVTPPRRARGRRNARTARTVIPTTARQSAWSQARAYRTRGGKLKTHSTPPRTVRAAGDPGTGARVRPGRRGPPGARARSAMRRPPQLGQNPRPLHEKGTRRSRPQPSHRNRAKPPASHPQRRKSRNSRSTNAGSPRPSRAWAASARNVSTWSRTTW
jgi:hypothetical protein